MQGADAEAVVTGMIGLLADVRTDLAQMTGLEPGLSARLLDQHARLLRFVQVYALGRRTAVRPDHDGNRPGTPFRWQSSLWQFPS